MLRGGFMPHTSVVRTAEIRHLPTLRTSWLGSVFTATSDEQSFMAWYTKGQALYAVQCCSTVFFVVDAIVRGYAGLAGSEASDVQGIVRVLSVVTMMVCLLLPSGLCLTSLENVVCGWALTLLVLVNASSEWRLGYVLGASVAERSDARTVVLTCLIYATVFLLAGIRSSRSWIVPASGTLIYAGLSLPLDLCPEGRHNGLITSLTLGLLGLTMWSAAYWREVAFRDAWVGLQAVEAEHAHAGRKAFGAWPAEAVTAGARSAPGGLAGPFGDTDESDASGAEWNEPQETAGFPEEVCVEGAVELLATEPDSLVSALSNRFGPGHLLKCGPAYSAQSFAPALASSCGNNPLADKPLVQLLHEAETSSFMQELNEVTDLCEERSRSKSLNDLTELIFDSSHISSESDTNSEDATSIESAAYAVDPSIETVPSVEDIDPRSSTTESGDACCKGPRSPRSASLSPRSSRSLSPGSGSVDDCYSLGRSGPLSLGGYLPPDATDGIDGSHAYMAYPQFLAASALCNGRDTSSDCSSSNLCCSSGETSEESQLDYMSAGGLDASDDVLRGLGPVFDRAAVVVGVRESLQEICRSESWEIPWGTLRNWHRKCNENDFLRFRRCKYGGTPVLATVFRNQGAPGEVAHYTAVQRLQFQRTAAALLRARHPNIIQLIGVVTTNHREGLCLVFEDCFMGSMRDWVLSGDGWTPTAGYFAAVQVARAVDYLHSIGCMHRAITPSNVAFLTRDRAKPIAKLTGFGLATLEGFHDSVVLDDADVLPAYVAPEVFDGEFGYPADVYALGITMYESCVGRGSLLDDELLRGMRQMLGIAPNYPMPPEMVTSDTLRATLRYLRKQGYIPRSDELDRDLPGVFSILHGCWLPEAERKTAQHVSTRCNVTLKAQDIRAARLGRALIADSSYR